MEENHKLTLYVSYYLSRFNENGLHNLGYTTWNEAFGDIASRLNVKRHSVKNWRDEFDPIHGHRAGWYQRPMSPSRVRVVKAMEQLNEPELRGIVLDILSGQIQEDSEKFNELVKVVTEEKSSKSSQFILRGPTGRKAEEFFQEYHATHNKPVKGELIDTRDLGCGYDFEIRNSKTFFVEVKGLANENGGVLFTNKEWETALRLKDEYILAIVTDVNQHPTIRFISNPAEKLEAKKNIVSTIQIQWSVSENQFVND
jgi:hypothetical protein